MNDRQTDEFLDGYKRLEAAAARLVGCDGHGSVVLKLARHRDFQQYEEQLDYCRQVRNLLTHEAKIDGQYGVTPSPAVMAFLQKMLTMLEHPRTLARQMTPVGRLLCAHRPDPLLPLMKQMLAKGFSHAPVLESGRVTGVFSVDTVFQWVLAGQPTISEQTTVDDLAEFLPLSRHPSRSYEFVPPDMPVRDAEDLFDKAYDQNQQIKLLLVTDKGDPRHRLLGVVSPYDLLDNPLT